MMLDASLLVPDAEPHPRAALVHGVDSHGATSLDQKFVDAPGGKRNMVTRFSPFRWEPDDAHAVPHLQRGHSFPSAGTACA
jgi:hypothetical protein